MRKDQEYLDAVEELEEVAKETNGDSHAMDKVMAYYHKILDEDHYEDLYEVYDMTRREYR